jgi:DNA primase
MMDNSSITNEIKSRIDIVDLIGEYLTLKKVGSGYQGLCPFHSEQKPSFYVSPERQSFKCFGCGAYGDIFTFIMKIEGISFREALEMLAQKAGVELKPLDSAQNTLRQRLLQLNENATRFFEKQMAKSQAGKEAQDYLIQRKINEESIKEWRLGYAPEEWRALLSFLEKLDFSQEEIIQAGLAISNEEKKTVYDRFRGRIIFPINDLSGRVVGFGGRVRPGKEEEGAKYLNTPTTFLYDKSRVLYGLDKARGKIREKGQVILVEGYTDVIASHQAGFSNTVSVSGTALTPYQAETLRRYTEKIIVAFDMDEAGRSATQRSIDLLQEKGFLIRIINVVGDLDPAEIINKSSKDWEKAIQESQSIFDFYFQRAFNNHSPEEPEGRKEILDILLPLLAKIPNRIEQAHWIGKLAQALRVNEESIIEELEKKETPASEKEEKPEIKTDFPSLSRKEKLERRILGLIGAQKVDSASIPTQQVDLFSPENKKIVQAWKKGKLESMRKKSRDLDNFLNLLVLEIDREKVEGEEELAICFTELEQLVIKEKLEELSWEIKKAEEEKKESLLEKLIQKFQKLSHQLNNHGQEN